MCNGAGDCDEQRPSSFIHHCFLFNHDMNPFTLSPFVKKQLGPGVRRGDLPLIGPTTWQISLCPRQYIFTLARAHTHTCFTHGCQRTRTNTKNECFRWREKTGGRQLTVRVTDCIVRASFGGCNKHRDIWANKSRIGSVINQSADSWLKFVCPALCIISDWISAN